MGLGKGRKEFTLTALNLYAKLNYPGLLEEKVVSRNTAPSEYVYLDFCSRNQRRRG